MMIAASVVFSVIGLMVIGFAGAYIPVLLPGIILAGIGYVLVVQTTTAWFKGLYPEGNHGQYEGVRIVFNVMIPMVIGPSIASILIDRFGNPVVIQGKEGMAPTAVIFFAAAALSVLTLVPMYMAAKQRPATKK